MNDIDHDDEAELIPLPPTPPMSRGRAFGLLTGIAALTLLFAKPDFGDAQHPDPESFMSHPENMAGVSDTLKAFAPEVAKRLTADNIKTRFVYTSAMADQIYSHFTDENQKKLQAMLEKFQQDGRQDDLVFGFISHFEGVRPKSYDDSEGVRTIGCGYAMSKPGTLIGGGPEKFMCETLGIDKDQYKEFYKGDRALSFSQMRKLTMDWIRKNNGIRESLNGTLSKITGQEDAINLLDPVHKACLLTMMYQSPAALTGMGKTKKITMGFCS